MILLPHILEMALEKGPRDLIDVFAFDQICELSSQVSVIRDLILKETGLFVDILFNLLEIELLWLVLLRDEHFQ